MILSIEYERMEASKGAAPSEENAVPLGTVPSWPTTGIYVACLTPVGI